MKSVALHLGVLVLLVVAQFVLPPYHANNLSRILVLAVFAMGYNIAFGYSGLLSLGHALLFAAGMYGAGMLVHHAGTAALPVVVAWAAVGFTLGRKHEAAERALGGKEQDD